MTLFGVNAISGLVCRVVAILVEKVLWLIVSVLFVGSPRWLVTVTTNLFVVCTL